MNYRYVPINDATYGYTIHGEGEALLLFHGFTGSSRTWEKCVRDLCAHYQVITLDLPGHGKTTTPTARTMESVSADVKEFLRFLGCEKIHLLGYSMGGRTALSFAMYHPHLVDSLILESASPGIKTMEERKARILQDKKLAKMIQTEGMQAFVDFWETIPLFETQKKLPKDVRNKIRHERLSHTDKGLIDSLLYMGTGQQPSWWEKLHTLSCPVLLVVGEEDGKFVEINRQMHQVLPNSQLIVVENAGHAIHVEQPEKFVTIVREFMTRNKG